MNLRYQLSTSLTDQHLTDLALGIIKAVGADDVVIESLQKSHEAFGEEPERYAQDIRLGIYDGLMGITEYFREGLHWFTDHFKRASKSPPLIMFGPSLLFFLRYLLLRAAGNGTLSTARLHYDGFPDDFDLPIRYYSIWARRAAGLPLHRQLHSLDEPLELEDDLSYRDIINRSTSLSFSDAQVAAEQHAIAAAYRFGEQVLGQIERRIDGFMAENLLVPETAPDALVLSDIVAEILLSRKTLRDADRVAIQETRWALNIGVLEDAARRRRSVYFDVRDDACADCKRTYLQVDGKPRLFDPLDIMDNLGTVGYNSGPHASWVALPVLHPFCRCRMRVAPLDQYPDELRWNIQP